MVASGSMTDPNKLVNSLHLTRTKGEFCRLVSSSAFLSLTQMLILTCSYNLYTYNLYSPAVV